MLFLLGWGVLTGAFAADHVIVEKIAGDRTVVVRTPKGNRVASPGFVLNYGDRVQTGPQATAYLRFMDGALLLVGRRSDFEVQKPQGSTEWATLRSGEVRGLVPKPKILLKQGTPPRFGIRTRTAVMGVRGTDFVLGLTELKTLEGVVEIAPTEKELLAGKGTLVEKGHQVHAGSQGISQPQSFDSVQFLKELRTSQPGLASAPSAAVSAAAGTATSSIGAANSAGDVPKMPAPGDSVRFQSLESSAPIEPHRQPGDLSGETPADRQAAALPQGAPRPPGPAPVRTRVWFRPFSFRFAGVYFKQKSGGELFSAQLSANPVIELPGPFSVRAHFGITPLSERGRGDKEKFLSLQLGLLAGVKFGVVGAEAGAGWEEWTSYHAKRGALIMGSIAYLPEGDGWLERIFLGISYFNRPPVAINPSFQVRGGIGFEW